MKSNVTLPGLIDPHVHLRDPGQTDKEDFYTGTSAALAGGYTTVIDMPNNTTPITTLEKLEEKIAIAKQKVVCDIGFYFGSLGNNLDEFERVKDKIMGLKLYLNQTTGNFLLDTKNLSRIFSALPLTLPILAHAEGNAVLDILNVIRETGHKAHICHVTALELQYIIKAKEEGLPITCGVTPHHLFLSEDDQKTLGPFGLMKPPLQSKKDVEFLWKNLKAIDVIESDHAPHTIMEKMGRVTQAEEPHRVPAGSVSEPRTSDGESERQAPAIFYGVPGLETTLPLLLTAASENRLTIEDIIRLCSTNPAKIFGIRTDPTTHVEVDMQTKYTIENSNLFTKCGWSPFNDWMVNGKITRVILRGKTVFENGKILATPGSGNIITPA